MTIGQKLKLVKLAGINLKILLLCELWVEEESQKPKPTN
jgi:hypothetical protein